MIDRFKEEIESRNKHIDLLSIDFQQFSEENSLTNSSGMAEYPDAKE